MNTTALKIENVNLSKITTNEQNPRKNFNTESLEELAQSIKAQGVLQPIVVRHRGVTDDGVPYEIICGERRFRASQILGLDTIPAVIRYDVQEEQVLELALTENLMREDITPLEEMMVYIAHLYHTSRNVHLLNLPSLSCLLISTSKQG